MTADWCEVCKRDDRGPASVVVVWDGHEAGGQRCCWACAFTMGTQATGPVELRSDSGKVWRPL